MHELSMVGSVGLVGGVGQLGSEIGPGLRSAAHRNELYRREVEAFAVCLASEDGQEGVAAFLEKRAPAWTGR